MGAMRRREPRTTRSRLRRILRQWAQTILACSLILSAVSAGLLFLSPLFLSKHVTVDGVHRLDEQKIVETAGVPRGVPLAAVDVHRSALRIAAEPRVKKVRVSRLYPHTVEIQVTERRSIAFFRADGTIFEVDEDAVLMKESRPPRGLPEMRVPRPAAPSLEREAVLQVAQSLPPHFRRRVRAIEADSAAMVMLRLRDGRTIELGSATRLEDKMRTIAMVLTQPGTTWNVANPELPTRR